MESKWSNEYHRDDIASRCYGSCGNFKLIRWLGRCDFMGVCMEGHDLRDDHCQFWKTDGLAKDPLLKDGNQLRLFEL